MQKVFTIGRSSDNDLVLTDPHVSSHHARITKTLDGLWLEDLNSSNGTYVGQERINRKQIRIGDPVRISVSVELDWSNDLLSHWVNQPLDAEVADSDLESSHRTGITGAWTFIIKEEKKTTLTIGRSADNDFVISHPRVSRYHAQLKGEKENAWWLEDLGSSNGTFVDGERISRRIIDENNRVLIAGLPVVLFPRQKEIVEEEAAEGEARIEVSKLSVKVPVRGGEKTLLYDISVVLNPGEFVGLIGPSGSGKTTLMMAMNGYLRPAYGSVHINAINLHKESARFRGFIGYVPQDDIIHPELTVESSLNHNAALRLPELNVDERRREVNRVIHDLGLEAIRDTEIGSPVKKGISGGQRKRVNSAQELITQPSVLFLDEPCSGLDPQSDKEVMTMLRSLTRRGKTVFLTTHNISKRNFEMLDMLVVLTESGYLAYFGPASKAAEYFEVDSPEDIFSKLQTRNATQWAETYQQSSFHDSYVAKRQHSKNWTSPTNPEPRPVHGLSQLTHLIARYGEIKLRDRLQTLILLLQAPIIGALIAAVFYDTHSSAEQPYPIATPLFLLNIAAIWLGASNAAREIVQERAIFRRERGVFLLTSNYLLSKLVVLAVIDALQVGVLLAFVFPVLDFSGGWFSHFLMLFAVCFTGTALGLMISSLASSENSALALVPVVLIPQVVLAGMIVRLKELPEFVQLISGLMLSRWGFEGSLQLESQDGVVPAIAERIVNEIPDTVAKYYGYEDENRLLLVLLSIGLWWIVYSAISYKRLNSSS